MGLTIGNAFNIVLRNMYTYINSHRKSGQISTLLQSNIQLPGHTHTTLTTEGPTEIAKNHVCKSYLIRVK